MKGKMRAPGTSRQDQNQAFPGKTGAWHFRGSGYPSAPPSPSPPHPSTTSVFLVLPFTGGVSNLQKALGRNQLLLLLFLGVSDTWAPVRVRAQQPCAQRARCICSDLALPGWAGSSLRTHTVQVSTQEPARGHGGDSELLPCTSPRSAEL